MSDRELTAALAGSAASAAAALAAPSLRTALAIGEAQPWRWVVRSDSMDLYADPSMPEMTAEEIASADFDEALSDVLGQVQQMSAEELQDGVHRHFEFRLCPARHRRFLNNPLGKPREKRVGVN